MADSGSAAETFATMHVTTPVSERRFSLTTLFGCGAWLLICAVATGADLSGSASRAATNVRGPAPRPVTFDPMVVPAGGAGCCGVNGRACGHAQHAGFHHDAGCRDGMCMPSCPVRPGLFGYYGTQWRRWPGQGVIQASATEAATPVAPPRSAVPGALEESPMRRNAEEADDSESQRIPEPPAGNPLAEPPLNEGAEAEPEDVPVPPQPEPGRRDSASIETAGPWSRLIASAHLPDGYEPPAAPVTDDQ